MRGASALGNELRRIAGRPLRVFCVWEPVIPSDRGAPSPATLARLGDRRVVSYWDPGRSLSQDLVRAVLAAPDRYALRQRIRPDTVVWDVVALFPRGARWDRDVPVPSFYGSPVEESMEGLRAALADADRPRVDGSP